MGFDWREYLAVARFVSQRAEDVGEEAARRCAISRAYYAVFCHARNYARDRQKYQPTYDGRDHHGVRNHFRPQRIRRISGLLGDLKTWRELCDYQDEVENLPLLVEQALDSAREVIDLL